MSKKKQKEIIKLLEETLLSESQKLGGGNIEIIQSLTKRLEKVKNWVKNKDK